MACISSLRANDEKPPNDSILVHSVQCEAGRVGQYLVTHGFPANLKMAVSWDMTNVNEVSSGVIVDFFHWISGGGDLGRQLTIKEGTHGISFNLHPANLAVCDGYKKDIIQEGVGVYNCLVNDKLDSLRAAVDGGAGTAICFRAVSISKKLNGGVKLEIWGVAEIGTSASWGNTYNYEFNIAAPTYETAR
jgi:hypothetical protein